MTIGQFRVMNTKSGQHLAATTGARIYANALNSRLCPSTETLSDQLSGSRAERMKARENGFYGFCSRARSEFRHVEQLFRVSLVRCFFDAAGKPRLNFNNTPYRDYNRSHEI